MKLFNLILKIIKKVKNPMTYMGNVYWVNDSWECPCDGFINLIVNSTTSSTYHLLYVSENGGTRPICSVSGVGAGSTATAMFPVQKGKKYKTLYAKNYGNIIEAHYYKIGGVLTNALNLLQSLSKRVIA